MRLPPSALFCLTLAFASIADAALYPITVRVEQKNKSQTDGPKTTQTKELKVLLGNSTKQEYSGLKVKYLLFARDVLSKDISLLEQGERPADLKGMNTAVVETPEVTATFTDEHSSGGRKGGNQVGANSKSKKVEASGQKMVGYAVQVFDAAGKLIGEAYEPLSMKEQVTKVGSTKAGPK